jgi:peptide/nickel transport system substrate-binding protein
VGRSTRAYGVAAAAAVLVLVGVLERASASAPEAVSPRFGGTLVVAGGDPGALNPAITSSGATHPVTGEIFNGLIRLDSDFNSKPDLARSWKISRDGRTYTFTLVRGVRWHDGRPFSSADVEFSYEQVLLKLHPRTRTLAEIIADVSAPNRDTVVFRLKTRYAPFLRWLDEDNGAIIPKHVYEGTDPLTNPANSRPIGTGPFKFESAIRGDRIVLVRNEQYFKKARGLPRLDRLIWRIMQPQQAVQAFEAGEVHVMLSPTGPDAERLKGRRGVVVTETGREAFGRVVPLILNLRKKPFDDVRVRRAMAYAIDRAFIARTAYAGLLGPATSTLTKHIRWAHTSDVETYPRNLRRARSLLDAAGYRAGEGGVRFKASLIFDPPFARQAELLKEQLGQVGIELDLRVMDMNSWVNRLYIQWDFDLGYTNLVHPPDPDIGYKRAYVCTNIVKVPFSNGSGYCNRRVDRLFDQAALELNQKKRAQLYQEIQRIIANDVPHIPLVDGIGPWIFSAEFKGFESAGSKATYHFGEKVWWTKGSRSRSG